MKRILCLIAISLFGILSAAAQSIDELNAEIKRAEAAIAKNEKLLKEVSASKQSNQTEIRLLQQKIKDREKIVANYNKQIKIVKDSISTKQSNVKTMQTEVKGLEGEIEMLNVELEKLKGEYANAVKADYKNMLVGAPLHFLFSSADTNTATSRMAMLERYREALNERGDKIAATAEIINAKATIINTKSLEVTKEINTLSDKEKQLKSLKNEQQKALNKLNKEKKQLDKAASKLAAEEKKISKELKKKQQDKEKAQKALQKIIDEEARKAQRKLTDAERRAVTILDGKFEQNKGKMLMPVNGGIIVEQFGTHRHPTQKNIMVNNKGVNIAAPKGSDVFAVFEGEVARVMFINGLNNCVMIKLGSYFTIYSNLASVCVAKGDKVATNAKLGTLSSGDNPDDYQLHFEVWNNTVNLDPELWLAR